MSNIHNMGEETQRPNEDYSRPVDVSSVGSSPSVNSVTAIKLSDGSDVSDTVLTGSASVSGDVITTPLIGSLTDGERYHIIVNYSISGNTYENYFSIFCTDDR